MYTTLPGDKNHHHQKSLCHSLSSEHCLQSVKLHIILNLLMQEIQL